MSGLDQRVVLAPDDGSLGPLLRIADDRLPPGTGYGSHEHRAVDVVAVVLAGSVTHRWAGSATAAAGDVAVLRAGRVERNRLAHARPVARREAERAAPDRQSVVRAAHGLWRRLAQR